VGVSSDSDAWPPWAFILVFPMHAAPVVTQRWDDFRCVSRRLPAPTSQNDFSVVCTETWPSGSDFRRHLVEERRVAPVSYLAFLPIVCQPLKKYVRYLWCRPMGCRSASRRPRTAP
jgi:hypothetical protein